MEGGKVRVTVWLRDASPAVLARLRKAGFAGEGTPMVANIRTGRIAAGRLSALAALGDVVFVGLAGR